MVSKAKASNRMLEGQVAWVIGASGAIGSVIAQALATQGATVVVSGRKQDVLETLCNRITAAGGLAKLWPVDICKSAELDAVASSIIAEFGRIDALVNTTSLSIFGDFLELSDAQWLEVLDAKLLGYMRSMRAVLPYMAKRGSGSIVNISGRGGKQPTPIHLPGGCANAAVNLLSKGIADIYFTQGIRVNVVAPGPIESPRFSVIKSTQEKAYGGTSPPKASDRMGTAADVADAVMWLLSDASRHTTGAVIPVDGGGLATV